ncbi:uncharacterized protein LOC116409535 [Xenopus tropicalis]|uniref:Uncharacterized protein LOC116409535 n=1 Tax=Xenopus tropicalis TaxID=8364 RepID=A0A8J1J872_XENTR|nr:uncharacterized protein LOC116409535 [Xenopus tropicalis]
MRFFHLFPPSSHAELGFQTFLAKCGEKRASHFNCSHTPASTRSRTRQRRMLLDAQNTRRYSLMTPQNDLPQGEECLSHIQNLEETLRNQIDKMEHLKLSVMEVLNSSTTSTGFNYIQQTSSEIKMSLAAHTAFLNDLNERMESLKISSTLWVNTKPKVWRRRTQSFGRLSVRSRFFDDTQSEQGWSPAWPRRNSDAASEMSCAW